MAPAARILTWNIEWGRRGPAAIANMRHVIEALSPDIICLTEMTLDFVPAAGHLITASEDWGYPLVEGRRKVALWSREPWSEVDAFGNAALPKGRFIAGETVTPIGPLQVIGVCIPWHGDHVSSGRRDSTNWQQHEAFLTGLAEVLAARTNRVVLVGDFNQAIPPARQPRRVVAALEAALAPHLRIATAGPLPPLDRPVIDHIGHTMDLTPRRVQATPNGPVEGPAWTDHLGALVELEATA
ncbi:endonuclease/exonuclease/phosphatase family protein [Paracraurococcus ruber]|uniref:Endonuclease/exonuclease/phosphatase domain-containing protein n=1 Tax=Paracraurococcus ruber TaxID=77675 RepID=A0ABS1CUH8_9PROT|nr:endonuclease/exonuclease/phosphatase family protein [Paracraurococcus ruber]MBK1657993.1 hypothetical protein [Paracraurococcus ruber]TDG33801.1 endonuclease/exonuclease/phosphatase family protein [Paracraurococcus ruber]